MIKKALIFFLLACLNTLNINAQNKKAEKAFQNGLSFYQQYNHNAAIEELNTALKYNPNCVDCYLLKAEIYAEIDSIELQLNALKSAINLETPSDKVFYILAEAQYKLGQYEDALNSLLKINDEGIRNKMHQKIELLNQKCEAAILLINTPVDFHPLQLSAQINSSANEYWPCISIDDSTLTFTRLVFSNSSNSPQEDFFQSKKNNKGSWEKAYPLLKLNTSLNEGAQSITADEQVIFFSACNRQDGFGSCDIYYSRKINDQWSTPLNAGAAINSNSWESQPSVTADGSFLYFSSNRAGGKGNKDIWRCELKGFNENGKPLFGVLENLGDSINTIGDEISPFIHPDKKSLYFSSDTWEGLGRSDIFISRNKAQHWSKAKNIGYPINSHLNEIGFIVSASGRNAFYASDREESKGIDLYSFDMPIEHQPTPVIADFGKLDELSVGNAIVLKNIFFAYNSFELLPESHSELQKLIRLFEQFPSLQIEIGGHTDNQGSHEYNLKLSTQRAKAVHDYLLDAGVNAKLISYRGYAESKAISSNETPDGRANNRRTEFTIIAR
ncbi:MAG: OmpA family protein [Mangrovibacterium sp.]